MTNGQPHWQPRLVAPLPAELVAERQRIRRLAATFDQRADRGRIRRRALLPTAVASGVLVGSGLLSMWARTSTPVTSSAPPSAAASAAASKASSSERAFLEKIRQALATDQTAIDGLPQVAASSLAASDAVTPATTGGGATPSGGGLSAISLPTLTVPAFHATTGASGIP